MNTTLFRLATTWKEYNKYVKPISPLLRNSSPSLNSLIVYSIFWTRTKWIPRLSQGGNDLIFVCRKCFCCSNLLVIVFWLIDNDIDHVASKDHTKIKTMQEGHWSVQNKNDKFIIFLFFIVKKQDIIWICLFLCVHLRWRTSFDWEALSFLVALDPKNRGDQEILDDIKIFKFKSQIQIPRDITTTSDNWIPFATLISLTRYWTLRLCGKQLFGAIALFRAQRICTQQQEIIRAAEHLLKVWNFVKS